MPCRLKTYLPVLKRLQRVKLAERRRILEKADSGLIECLAECAHNTLNSNLPLSSKQHKRLSPYKKIIRFLANKKVSIKKKKKAVVRQVGGFLLPLIAPILAAIVQGLILRK
jgi:hypothetical protein